MSEMPSTAESPLLTLPVAFPETSERATLKAGLGVESASNSAFFSDAPKVPLETLA